MGAHLRNPVVPVSVIVFSFIYSLPIKVREVYYSSSVLFHPNDGNKHHHNQVPASMKILNMCILLPCVM